MKKPKLPKATKIRKRKIDATWLDTHEWMLRSSDNGVSYNGFKWPAIGRWATAKDWNSRPECGGGFHGISPAGHGFGFMYSRLELCETKGQQIVINGKKVKVSKARIVATLTDIPDEAFTRCGYKVFHPVDGDTISPQHDEIYIILAGNVTVSNQAGGICRFYDSATGTVSNQAGGICRFDDGGKQIAPRHGGQ